MAGISLGGLISGMDTDTIISKLMEIENQRITQQENRKSVLEAKQKAWQQVRSSITTLRLKLDAIRFASSYRVRTATLSDDSVATVTANTGATLTTHTLEVRSLATAHTVAGSFQESATAQLGQTGDLTINGKTIQLVATDSLYSIRDKINALEETDVRADVRPVAVGGATEYRLVLSSSKTGTAGAITMSSTSGATQGLGFQDASGTYLQELAAARNADFFLDGIHYDNQSSNTISDLLPDMTITLKKGGATTTEPDATLSTTISISTDADKIVSSVKDWIEALNESMELLSDLTSYDSDTKVAGTLQGDYLARNLQTSLRRMLSNVVDGLPTGMRQLSDIGITTGQYGTADYGKVLLDEEKLKSKLTEDAEGVARVLGALQKNVALASNGGTVTYSSVMTGDSEHVYSAADVINGETSSGRFGTAGGGWASAGAPDPNADPPVTEWLAVTFAKTAVNQVQLYFPESSNVASYRVQYWDSDKAAWETAAEVTNQGSTTFAALDFDPVVTTQMRLEVTATRDNGPVRGVTELQVHQQNKGAALEMYRYVNTTLGVEGALEIRDETLSDQIEDIDDQITKISAQLEAKEASLREQFARMEEALSELQSQGNALTSYFSGNQR